MLDTLSDPATRIVFSAVSSWEAQIQVGLGKRVLTEPLQTIVGRELTQNRWKVLPVSLQHPWRPGTPWSPPNPK